jgi:hypothetical protein
MESNVIHGNYFRLFSSFNMCLCCFGQENKKSNVIQYILFQNLRSCFLYMYTTALKHENAIWIIADYVIWDILQSSFELWKLFTQSARKIKPVVRTSIESLRCETATRRRRLFRKKWIINIYHGSFRRRPRSVYNGKLYSLFRLGWNARAN